MRIRYVISAACVAFLVSGCGRTQARNPTARGGGPPASAMPQHPTPPQPNKQLPTPYTTNPELL